MICVCVCVSQSLNQVVLWDKIVLRGENTRLNLKDTKSKYFFFDDGNGLRLVGQTCTHTYSCPLDFDCSHVSSSHQS